MKLLELNQISPEGVESLRPSFNNLPETSHKDGKYRLRKYSIAEVRTTFWNADREASVCRLPHRSFLQSEDLNKHQGGMSRDFEEIEESTLQSKGMREALLLFKDGNKLIDGQEVEIHQMRVRAFSDPINNLTPVSPEGIHQDGFNYIAMLGVNRSNVFGGALMVYTNKKSSPFLEKELQPGEIIMLDDRKLWHNAKDIWARDIEKESSADWFVFCAK